MKASTLCLLLILGFQSAHAGPVGICAKALSTDNLPRAFQRVSANEAAILASEFIEKKALLGTIQVVSFLYDPKDTPESIKGQENRQLFTSHLWKSAERRRAMMERRDEFNTFNQADRALYQKHVDNSLLLLERILNMSFHTHDQRGPFIENLRRMVTIADSANDILGAMDYLQDLRKNQPQKYLAFVEAWKASAPLAYEMAIQTMRMDGAKSETLMKISRKLKSDSMPTVISMVACAGLGAVLEFYRVGEWMASGAAVGAFISTLVAGNLMGQTPMGFIRNIPVRLRAPLMWLKRGYMKSKVQLMAQRTLALGKGEAQRLTGAGEIKEGSRLNLLQDLDRAGLERALSEDMAVDMSDDASVQKLGLRQLKIMDAMQGQVALLSERKETIQLRIDQLIESMEKAKKEKVDNRQEHLNEIHEIQGELLALSLDAGAFQALGAKMDEQLDRYISAAQPEIYKGSIEHKISLKGLAEQLPVQKAILAGFSENAQSISLGSQAEVQQMTMLSLGLLAQGVGRP